MQSSTNTMKIIFAKFFLWAICLFLLIVVLFPIMLYLESVEYYKKLLPSYKYGIIYYETFDCSNKENWKEIGRASSLFLSEHLLKVRTKLFSEGHTFINVFGAGSCKVCEKCQFPCRFPDKAVVPLEATGLNVVDFMKEFDVFIKFPIDNEFMRIGMVLYDE